MSTASSHSPTELKAGKEGRGLSASVMDELSVLEDKTPGWLYRNEYVRPGPLQSALHRTVPACQRGGTDAIRGADALAQGWVDLAEGGPLCPLLLPAVQHQLMEMWWTVDWSRQPETIFNGLDHLQNGQKKKSNSLGEAVRLSLRVALLGITITECVPRLGSWLKGRDENVSPT